MSKVNVNERMAAEDAQAKSAADVGELRGEILKLRHDNHSLTEQLTATAADLEALRNAVLLRDNELNAKAAELDALKVDVAARGETIVSLEEQIDAKDAGIVEWRRVVSTLARELTAAKEALARANNPVHGIAPPPTLDNMPALDQIPVHKAID